MKKTALVTTIIAALIAGSGNGLAAATQQQDEIAGMIQPHAPEPELQTANQHAPNKRHTEFFYASGRQPAPLFVHGIKDIKDNVVINLQ